MAVLLLQTLGSKGVALFAQIALARLLTKEDFGLFAMATTVTAFTDVIRDGGLGTVLVHRGKRFDRWAPLALGFGIALGLCSTAIILIAAPLVGWAYSDGRSVALLWMLALAPPLNALATVYLSRLYIDLRFTAIAWCNFLSQTGLIVLSVVFALFGFGAMSFAIPYPIIAMLGFLLARHLTGIRVRADWSIGRWRYLLRDSAIILSSGLAQCVFARSDYVLLGIFCTTDIVGVYFFAFNLSMQVIALVVNQLGSVLFPALAQLGGEASRQGLAFLNASRLLGAIAIPFCFLQAALADPLIPLVFHEKWRAAIPIFQLLSIAMALRVTGGSFASLLLAQGRFRTRLWLDIVAAITYLVLVSLGLWLGGPVAVAFSVVICFVIFRPLSLYVTVHSCIDRPWRRIFVTLVPSLACASIAVGGATLIGLEIKAAYGDLAYVIVVTALSMVIYLPLLHLADRTIIQELWQMLRRGVIDRIPVIRSWFPTAHRPQDKKAS